MLDDSIQIWTVEQGIPTEIKMNDTVLKISKNRRYSVDPVEVAKMFADAFEDTQQYNYENDNCVELQEPVEGAKSGEKPVCKVALDYVRIPNCANWYYAEEDETVIVTCNGIKNFVVETTWSEIVRLSKLSNTKLGRELTCRYQGSKDGNANKRIALYVIVTAYQKGEVKPGDSGKQ